MREQEGAQYEPRAKPFESPVNQQWQPKGFHSHSSSFFPIMTPSDEGSVREVPFLVKDFNQATGMVSPSIGRNSPFSQLKEVAQGFDQGSRSIVKNIEAVLNPSVLDELRSIQRSVQKLELGQKQRDLELQSLILNIREQKLREESSKLNQRMSRKQIKTTELQKQPKKEVHTNNNTAQTSQSFGVNIQLKASKDWQEERQRVKKEKQQLEIEIQAEIEGRRINTPATNSNFTFTGEPTDQAEREKQVKRYEEAKERWHTKVKEVEMLAQQSRTFQEQIINERAEYERKLCQQADELYNLQEKIDSSKNQQVKAQKIIEGSNAFTEENNRLLERLREVKEEGEKKTKEREEVASIHEQSIALLKSQISQNKNKSCNNCLLYINEKQNYKLKIEQEEKNQRRMERDHHHKKSRILSKCKQAMSQLEKQPLSYLHSLHRLQDTLQAMGEEKRVLEGSFKNLKKLSHNRTTELRAKEEQLDLEKKQLEECRERVNTHEERVAGLEQQIEEFEGEEAELKQSNEKITGEVRKNAVKHMMLKDREAELEDKLNALRKEKKRIMEEIEALPKKQREKILKH